MQYELLRLLGTGGAHDDHYNHGGSGGGGGNMHNPIAAATVASYGHGFDANGGGGGGGGGVFSGGAVRDPRAVQVFCAGDDDQSVYAWRGVHAVENMRRFASEFPGASVLHLDRSYRLPTHVLSAATELINKNPGRLGKPVPKLGLGGPALYSSAAPAVHVQGVFDGTEEARYIADQILAADYMSAGDFDMLSHTTDSSNNPTVAVFVRSAWQIREFEEQFMVRGIPFHIDGSTSFFSRPELRFPLALFRALVNPADEIAFTAAASHSCVAGMGDLTMQTLAEMQRERQAAETVAQLEAMEMLEPGDEFGEGGEEREERMEEAAAEYTLLDAARDALVEGMVRGRAATALGRFLGDFGRWREMLCSEADGGSTNSALLQEILYESVS